VGVIHERARPPVMEVRAVAEHLRHRNLSLIEVRLPWAPFLGAPQGERDRPDVAGVLLGDETICRS
jgi:hypothetical protein